MNLDKIFSKKGLVFLLIFSVLTFVGLKINFSPLIGADNQFFTLFQFFGPIAGGFLGPIIGAFSVLIALVTNFFVVGKEFTLINVLRIAPMLFAAYYFGSKKKNWSVIVPLIAMAAFIAHPVGRTVWFFTLFWTIPIIARLLPAKYSMGVPLKSLGATFTAHSVGGALWIWTVPMTSGQWIALIPIVIFERLLFAAGIGISYVTFNAVFDKVLDKLKIKVPSDILRINKKFTLRA
jgi:hypothetical protein